MDDNQKQNGQVSSSVQSPLKFDISSLFEHKHMSIDDIYKLAREFVKGLPNFFLFFKD